MDLKNKRRLPSKEAINQHQSINNYYQSLIQSDQATLRAALRRSTDQLLAAEALKAPSTIKSKAKT